MRQEIEAFLEAWVQENPPEPRKSDTQLCLEKLVPTITDLRRKGYGWRDLAEMLDKSGLRDANGQRMKADTLRRKAVRAGYAEPAAGLAETSSAAIKPNEADAPRAESEDQTPPAAAPSHPTGQPTEKVEKSTSTVFTSANEKRRPRRQEELTPYTTADVTREANQDLSTTEGGQ